MSSSKPSAAGVLEALMEGFRVGRALEDGRMGVGEARRVMTAPSATARPVEHLAAAR